MKVKGWFSDNIKKNRRIYAAVFAVLLLALFGLVLFYNEMGKRTFIVKGTMEGTERSMMRITYERSKEWSEHSTAGFDKGMEYDFDVTNDGAGDIYDWQAEIIFTSDYAIDSSWNGSFEKAEHKRVVRPDEENSEIPAGSKRTFGLVMISLEEQSVGEYRLYYKEDFTVTDTPFFWGLVAAIIITFSVFCTDELNHHRYRRLRERQEEIQAILVESYTTFANIIDAKDPYTQGHSLRVAEYARLIAGRMGYDENERERVYWIAMLHDIGKIGITDTILQKPGQLDNSEYSTIQTHVDIGGEILKDFKALPGIEDGARYHHERWDGKGYSSHLTGKDIPEIARIICVADSFDAMTSPRVYRKALPVDFAREELVKCSGTQFDPDIVSVMLALIDDEEVPVEIEA